MDLIFSGIPNTVHFLHYSFPLKPYHFVIFC